MSLTKGFLLCLVALCFISPSTTLAQSNKPAEPTLGDRDQTLKQLLTEVASCASQSNERTSVTLGFRC